MDSYSKSLPQIQITKTSSNGKVEYNQVLGSFMDLKLNESVSYVTYEVMKGKGLLSENKSFVRGRAKIHGKECLESVSHYNNFNDDKVYEVISFDRIKDNKVQSLAYIEEYPNGVREFYTFKDKHFMEHWAIGENGSGLEVSLKANGNIIDMDGHIKSSTNHTGLCDLTGEYLITIGEKTYEAVRLVLFAAENQVSDFFIDRDGKELFHRFFIPDEGFNGKFADNPYSTQYPDAEVLKVNDRKCVCTSYVFRSDIINAVME